MGPRFASERFIRSLCYYGSLRRLLCGSFVQEFERSTVETSGSANCFTLPSYMFLYCVPLELLYLGKAFFRSSSVPHNGVDPWFVVRCFTAAGCLRIFLRLPQAAI